jgi:DNA-directed RNA polymerase subunit RPC12/RpoP
VNFLKKYYKNTTTFRCSECKHVWKLTWWQWLCTIKFDITRHRYVKCPRCGVRHWIQAEKVVK